MKLLFWLWNHEPHLLSESRGTLNTFEHIKISGLYPCGEGSGYAGGIVSSAVDGMRAAEAISKN